MAVQNTTAPIYYSWQNDKGVTVATTPDLLNALAGNYRFVFKDGSACDTLFSQWYNIPDKGTISIDTSAMVITPAACGRSDGSITGIQSTNAGSFSWINTGNGGNIGTAADLTNSAGGAVELTISNSLGCQAQLALTVPQIPTPTFDYHALQEISDTCNAGLGAIKALGMTDAGRRYTWSWYAASNSATPLATTAGYLDHLKPGDYVATVSDQYACTVTSKDLSIPDVELSPEMPQVAGVYIPRYTAATLTVNDPAAGEYILFDGPSFGAAVLDSTASGVLHTPDMSQDMTLYVGFVRGDCTSPLAPVNIKVFDSVRVFVPNAFTPNGDGSNDRWHILVQGLIRKLQVSVFDRWGTMVFSSSDPHFSWDGNLRGQPLSGTFVYMIAGIDYYNKPFQLKGTIIIVR
jgi:gliding motility-associated-like protein